MKEAPEPIDEKPSPKVALVMGTMTDGTHFTTIPTKEGLQVTIPGPFGKDISITVPFEQKRNLFRKLIDSILRKK